MCVCVGGGGGGGGRGGRRGGCGVVAHAVRQTTLLPSEELNGFY